MIDETLIPLAALAIPIVVVPTVLTFKLMSRTRQMAHLERMKAMELGTVLPATHGWPVAAVCVTLGLLLPSVCLLTAYQFWWDGMHGGGYVREWLVITPLAMAALGVVSAGLLAAKLLRSTPAPILPGKPVIDPDAYDVVGRRG